MLQPQPCRRQIPTARRTRSRSAQNLVLTTPGKRPADALLLVAPLFDVHTRSWRENLKIAIKGRHIARTGPAGIYPGTAAQRAEKPGLTPITDFGEPTSISTNMYIWAFGGTHSDPTAAIPALL